MNSKFEVNPKFYSVTPNEPNFWVELDFRFQNWVGSSSLFGRIKGNELDFFDFPTFNKGSTNNFCCCFDGFLISLYICIAGGWKSSWLYTLSKIKNQSFHVINRTSAQITPQNQEISQNVTNSRYRNIRYVSAIICFAYIFRVKGLSELKTWMDFCFST